MRGLDFRHRKPRLCAAIVMAAICPMAQAGVVMAGTRIAYIEQNREKTVQLTNEGDTPSFVRSWIDDGDPEASPESVQVPFHLTPANVRVDPHRGQQLRITYIPDVGDPLPPDRESVFYLNVLDIPPRPDMPGNVLQFAVRTRVKLFFRPATLEGEPGNSAALLRWSAGATAHGPCLNVHNPSAFHVSINDASISDDVAILDPAMVAPGATACLPLNQPASDDAQLRFHWMDDYGSLVEQTAKLQAAVEGQDEHAR